MKVPRDLTGNALAKALGKYGYEITRQSGSHLRLTTGNQGEHHITIPNHSQLKVGTLSAILFEVATHFNKTKSEIIQELFW